MTDKNTTARTDTDPQCRVEALVSGLTKGLSIVGKTVMERPAVTVLALLLIIAISIMLAAFAAGILYYPGALVVGCVFGIFIGTMSMTR